MAESKYKLWNLTLKYWKKIVIGIILIIVFVPGILSAADLETVLDSVLSVYQKQENLIEDISFDALLIEQKTNNSLMSVWQTVA